MLVQYRHVDFNDSFDFQGKMYIKHNHGRAQLDSNNHKKEFRRFKKNDIVLSGDKLTVENAWMKISDSIVDACPEELQEIRANGERDLV